jgi:DNA modification methylase
MTDLQILIGDCREQMRTLADGSVQTCVTSPPYFGLRDYGVEGQLGLEPSPGDFVAAMVEVFREVRRVLADDGTLWLNLGDSYGGAKQLLGVPWRVALALQDDGWCLRQDIIWHKPNPMPESVRDRCTKAHEYIFLLSKSPKYYFDAEAIAQPLADSSKQRLAQANLLNQRGSERVPGKTNGNMKAVGPRFGGDKYGKDTSKENRTKSGEEWDGGVGKANKRSVWTVTTKPFKGAHFATFPPDLIEPCVLAGSRPGDIVLDPFGGSGTTAGVAIKHGRKAVLCELNPDYAALVPNRIASIVGEGWDLL